MRHGILCKHIAFNYSLPLLESELDEIVKIATQGMIPISEVIKKVRDLEHSDISDTCLADEIIDWLTEKGK